MDSLFPGVLRLDSLNSCDDSGDELVECTETCDSGRQCNKYLSGFTDCWYVARLAYVGLSISYGIMVCLRTDFSLNAY